MEKETVILKFTELVALLHLCNDDFDNFLINNKITSGRDFRRTLRSIRDISKECIKLSLDLEHNIRDKKKEKKNGAR